MKLSFSMWGKALRIIPRVSKKEWDVLDPISRWLIASRSAVFIMTAFSVFVGAVLAVNDKQFAWIPFVLCLFGLVLAHATNNLLNDYTDSSRGVDTNNYFRTLYGPQVIEDDLWTKAKLLRVIIFSGSMALACGIALILLYSSVVIWPLVAGIFFVLFYTWPLKFIGLGEPSVLLVWGPLMVGGTYAAITGDWNWSVALIGLVYALGPTTVLFGKHTDKLTEDKAKKIHTLPVIIGEKYARWSVIVMIISQPIIVATLVLSNILEWPMFLTLLGLPTILTTAKVFSRPRPTTKPANHPKEGWPTYLAGFAFKCNRVTGMLFVLGLVISIFA